jgi:DNA polymerase III subunit chi
MTEIHFYHLERRTPEQALPALVEQAFAARVNIAIEAPDRNYLERLDERLWTFSDESFLPHAIAGEAPLSQAVLLTIASDNPNGAKVRFLLAGAKAESALIASPDSYERIVILFNGSDEDEVAEARAQWAQLKAAGRAISYWRQADAGGWEKVR